MISFPNAKINIGLSITEKRNDGFHNIESCFYPIQWCDILEIVKTDHFSFQSTGIPIPPGENLCTRAYHLLAADYNLSPVNIHLHKLIPIGAGLGGGSADAAYTLKMLSALFELNLNTEQLIDYSKKLGSDCAFFIRNEPVIATEKGDTFQACKLDLSGYHIILVYPNLHISTAEAYSGVSPQKATFKYSEINVNHIKNNDSNIKNDFEDSLFKSYEQLAVIKEELYKYGAVYASLTGSGSTVYGIFEKKVDIEYSNFTTKALEL